MARGASTKTIEAAVRNRIRELRVARGFTQEQLCERAEISIDAVTRIESGSRTPTLSTLVSIAKALGVELSELVRTEPLPPPTLPPAVERVVTALAQQPSDVQEAAEKIVRVLVSISRRG